MQEVSGFAGFSIFLFWHIGAANAEMDSQCKKMELVVLEEMANQERRVLDGAAPLIDAARLLQFANQTCETGDVKTAVMIYRSILEQLAAAVRDITPSTKEPLSGSSSF
jgi:hypothetical protein